jgi:hypothetical protein
VQRESALQAANGDPVTSRLINAKYHDVRRAELQHPAWKKWRLAVDEQRRVSTGSQGEFQQAAKARVDAKIPVDNCQVYGLLCDLIPRMTHNLNTLEMEALLGLREDHMRELHNYERSTRR